MTHSLLGSRLRHWLINMLILLLNLVCGLANQLVQMNCAEDSYCVATLSEPFFVFALFFAFALVWHLGDLASYKPLNRFLQIAFSPLAFTGMLIALIGGTWLYATTSYVDYYGYWRTPFPVGIVTFGLLFLVPLLALTKLLWAIISTARTVLDRRREPAEHAARQID